MRFGAAFGLLVTFFCACLRSGADRQAKVEEVALAMVDGRSITPERLEAHARVQPSALRARYGSSEAKRQLLDGVIQIEVLLAEARRLGLDKDPEVIRAQNQILIDKLFATKGAQAPTKTGPVTSAEAERYYREHLANFQQMDRVRVRQILVADKALGERLVSAARRAPRKAAEESFAKIVKEHSIDEPTRARDGDSGLFDRQDGRLPAPFLTAALALEQTGDVALTGRTDRGFFVLRLIEKRPAGPAAFEEVEEEIKMRLGQ